MRAVYCFLAVRSNTRGYLQGSLEFCLGRLAKILNSVSGQKQLELDNQNLKLFFISLDLYSAQ